ncbi:hypothetical protein EW145_g6308 [Phellinidium pouzarii]|uniref:Protein kinase domain-containing protein n=1 Tax=Phellinidium pouzarii TaxID=167371 RepID=A0A4S4KXK3_9AGAM|nr:hypothetical protein EW145_g6308 [Phellinidium pouzarii]
MPFPILEDGTTLPGLRFISKRKSSVAPVFHAKMNRVDVFVKFARNYCVAAHKHLAGHGLAPKLLSCVRIRGGFWMVVMDYIVGKNAHDFFFKKKLSPPVLAEVRRAIELLHNDDFVFGDLRRSNIMVVKGGRGVLLVDFDWCGKAGEARYPALLNNDVVWAPDVVRRGLIEKEHDLFRMRRLESGF